ncbi:MAG: LysR family transcriptional regulator [Myxococcota bacterium]
MNLQSDPDFRDLAAFVRVVDCGSISAAARALSVTKSVVSRRLKRLEERLGVQLVERSTRSLRITSSGEVLYQRSRPALEALEAAHEEVREGAKAVGGLVRIAAPPDVGGDVLPWVLTGFAERHPDVEVEVFLTRDEGDLIANGYDLAIRGGRQPDSALVIRLMNASPFILVASPAYLARAGRPTKPADIAHHRRLVFLRHGKRFLWPTETGGHATMDACIRSDDLRMLRKLCELGAGIACLPADATRGALASGALEHVLPGLERRGSSLYILQTASAYLRPSVRALRDHLVDFFRQPSAFEEADGDT